MKYVRCRRPHIHIYVCTALHSYVKKNVYLVSAQLPASLVTLGILPPGLNLDLNDLRTSVSQKHIITRYYYILNIFNLSDLELFIKRPQYVIYHLYWKLIKLL